MHLIQNVSETQIVTMQRTASYFCSISTTTKMKQKWSTHWHTDTLIHSFRFLCRCECLHNIVPTVVCGERIKNTSGSVVGVGAFCSQCRRRCCEWYKWRCTWITRFMPKWTPNGSKSCSQYGGGIDRKNIKWYARRQSRPWLAAWHGQGRHCQRGSSSIISLLLSKTTKISLISYFIVITSRFHRFI